MHRWSHLLCILYYNVSLVCVYTELNPDPSHISAHVGICNSLVSLSVLSSKMNILVYFG